MRVGERAFSFSDFQIFSFPVPVGTVKTWHRPDAASRPGEVRVGGTDGPTLPHCGPLPEVLSVSMPQPSGSHALPHAATPVSVQ